MLTSCSFQSFLVLSMYVSYMYIYIQHRYTIYQAVNSRIRMEQDLKILALPFLAIFELPAVGVPEICLQLVETYRFCRNYRWWLLANKIV